MNNIFNSKADAGMNLLADAAVYREEMRNKQPSAAILFDSDGASDSPYPIFNTFYNTTGSKCIMLMTQFFSIGNPSHMEQFFRSYYASLERRMRSQIRFYGKRCIFLLLCGLENGGNRDFLGHFFSMKGPIFERLITGFLKIIPP